MPNYTLTEAQHRQLVEALAFLLSGIDGNVMADNDVPRARAAIALLQSLPAQPGEPVGHLHSNGDFCMERMPQGVTVWPITLYASPSHSEPIQAHSKSQYKRLSALGANVIEPASSERQQQEEDALRYRWLRDNFGDTQDGDTMNPPVASIQWHHFAMGVVGAGPSIDAAIDAARGKEA